MQRKFRRAQLDQKEGRAQIAFAHSHSGMNPDSDFLNISGCLWTKKNDLAAAVGG
jgi:hypothetical protein